MYPVLFEVGGLTITSFGLMIALAFLAGYQVIRLRLRELDRPEDLAGDILFGALIGGILGAKVYYLILNWEWTVADPAGMILSRAGLVWYGGLIGGALGVVIAVRRRAVSIPLAADVTAPALALAYGLGRIGCFLVGDDYGRPTDSWLGMSFPEGSPPTTAGAIRRHFGGEAVPSGVPETELLSVIPTQLFEAGAAGLVFWVLWRWRNHPHRTGWLFALWMMAMGAERFLIEILRVKDDRVLGPLTVAQLFSVGLVLVGVYLWDRTRRPAGVRSGESPTDA